MAIRSGAALEGLDFSAKKQKAFRGVAAGCVIDVARHVTGFNFVQAVKVGLGAINNQRSNNEGRPMFDEQKHLGGITSRTNEASLVAEPIIATIDGHEVALSLSDASLLCAGLAGAIARVRQSERQLMGDRGMYNLAVIGQSGSGMSMPRSKLGGGEFVFHDSMLDRAITVKPGFKTVAACSDISQLANLSEADAAAVLSNCSTRIVFKQ